MSWKFADETRLIVSRDLPGGGIDSRSVNDAEVIAWIEAGNTPEPAQAHGASELFAAASEATQQRLDAFARARGYDGILSLCTYASDPDPVYAAEGQTGIVARSNTWAALRVIRDAVLAGQRPKPTTWAEVEAELPALSWS